MANHVTFRSYIIGFTLSVVLTLAAYLIVESHVLSDHESFSHGFLLYAVIVLALIQLFVQMKYFLHLGRESKPKNNLMTFILTVLFVSIVVGGSLWIMNNLNHNMSHERMEEYMYKEVGI